MTESYTSKISRNSLWATSSFVVASLCNFAMSVAVTRYFGKEIYGQYSYFLWLSGVLGIFAGFGFQQTAAKYFSKYFFAEKDRGGSGGVSNGGKTNSIFRKLLVVQVFGSLIIAALCVMGVGYFEQLIRFEQPQKALLLIIAFLSVVPVSLNTFLTSSFSAIQEFKKLSRTHMGMSILNLLIILGFVFTQQSLTNFLWIYFGLTLFTSCILLAQAHHLLKKPSQKNPPVEKTEKIFAYSIYAYVSIICTQIVWERSEVFFLGMFSDSGQIAIYTLSYALAVLFISVWGPLNGVMNAVTAEVVLTEKQDKLLMITQHGTKFLAMLILPLALLASLFMGDLIIFIYGKNFSEVALLFPFLVLAHAVAVIITPAGSIPMLKNEMKKSMVFNIATAAVNIVLDIYLITRYQAFGAMLANVISQFFSIGLSLINAKKYRLGIFNKYMIRIFFINTLLAGLFLGIAQYDFFIRLIIALTASLLYMTAMFKTAFNEKDLQILENLKEAVPKKIRPLLSFAIRKIKKTARLQNI